MKLNKPNFSGAEKRPKTDLVQQEPGSLRKASYEEKLSQLKGPAPLKKFTRSSLASKATALTEKETPPFAVFWTNSTRIEAKIRGLGEPAFADGEIANSRTGKGKRKTIYNLDKTNSD